MEGGEVSTTAVAASAATARMHDAGVSSAVEANLEALMRALEALALSQRATQDRA